MTRHRVEVRTCDRCGAVEKLQSEDATYAWGGVLARGRFPIGMVWRSAENAEWADLCPQCVRALKDWWEIGRRGTMETA